MKATDDGKLLTAKSDEVRHLGASGNLNHVDVGCRGLREHDHAEAILGAAVAIDVLNIVSELSMLRCST